MEATGQQRAQQARAGTLGSSIGEAAIKKTKELGREEVRGVQQRKLERVADIEVRAEERIEREIALKKQETFAGAQVRLNYLKTIRDEARADIKTLAESGVTLEALKEGDYYDQFVEESGYDPFTFDAIYEGQMPEEEQTKYDWYFKGNNLVGVGIDPATGKMSTKTYTAEELGIPTNINPEFVTNEQTGDSWYYDKDNPETDEEGNLKLTLIKEKIFTPEEEGVEEKDTQIVEVGGRKVLVDKQTGETIKDLGPAEGDEESVSWNQGRTFIDDNPNASYEELLTGLQEHTDLEDSEVKSLLASKGKKPTEEVEEEKEFLTRDWFIENFGKDKLKAEAKEDYASLWHGAEWEMNQYLDAIMKGIEARRAAGMTDQEILKAMK